MDPSQRLSFVIGQVAAEIAERGAQAVSELGLDGRSLSVLMFLDQEITSSQRELGEVLGIDRTTMVSVMDGLESARRITRERVPPDRRNNKVTITEHGRSTLAAADHALQHCEDEFVEALDEAERVVVMNLLAKLPQKEIRRHPGSTPG